MKYFYYWAQCLATTYTWEKLVNVFNMAKTTLDNSPIQKQCFVYNLLSVILLQWIHCSGVYIAHSKEAKLTVLHYRVSNSSCIVVYMMMKGIATVMIIILFLTELIRKLVC